MEGVGPAGRCGEHGSVKGHHGMGTRGEQPVGIGPAPYATWHASQLGRVTEHIEHALVLRLAGMLDRQRVLDVGCGDGTLAVVIARQGATVTGIDADPDMLDAARAHAEAVGAELSLRQGKAEALPFPDASFDVVIAVTVLCFVPEAGRAVQEMARVLRPGGRLVLGELGRWSTWAARRRLRGWLGNAMWRRARFRGPNPLRQLATDAGLVVECIEGAVFYPPVAWLARVMAPLDRWLGRHILFGAAFLVVAANKPSLTELALPHTEPFDHPTVAPMRRRNPAPE